MPAAKHAAAAGASTIGISTVRLQCCRTSSARIAFESPDAPELVASAASTSTTRPCSDAAIRMLSSKDVSGCCIWARASQKSRAIASASTAKLTPSPARNTFEQRSATSVNGLPINKPPDKPPGPFSIAIARCTNWPKSPLAVMHSAPRTSAGIGTRTITGLTPPASRRNSNRAERCPVSKKST